MRKGKTLIIKVGFEKVKMFNKNGNPQVSPKSCQCLSISKNFIVKKLNSYL